MKLLHLLLTKILFVFCVNYGLSKAIIVHNSNENIVFSYTDKFDNSIISNSLQTTINKHSVSYSIDVENYNILIFNNNFDLYPLLIFNNDSIYITKLSDGSYQFSGNNNFDDTNWLKLIERNQRLIYPTTFEKGANKNYLLEAEYFKASYDSRIEFLTKVNNAKLKTAYKDLILYRYIIDLLNPFYIDNYQKYINKIPVYYINTILSFENTLNEVQLLENHLYRVVLWNFSKFYCIYKQGNSITNEHLIESIKTQFPNGKIQEYLLFRVFKGWLKEDFKDELTNNTYLIDFLNNYPYGEYSNYLKSLFKTNSFYTNPKILEVKNLNNLEGKEKSLTDILNTHDLSYIDFWASWCSPCRAEMPASKQLGLEYERKGIKFVYISIDESSTAWEKASIQLGIPDTCNYLISDAKNSELIKQFKISSIPRYMIIGKDGKVINADAPRPSDAKLRKIFDELLKK